MSNRPNIVIIMTDQQRADLSAREGFALDTTPFMDYCYTAGHLDAEDSDATPETRAFKAFLKETHFHLALEPTPFPLEVQLPYRIVDKAQNWVASVTGNAAEAAGDAEPQPFLLWLSFPEPHNPYQVPEPYFSLFPPEELPPNVTDASTLAAKVSSTNCQTIYGGSE